MIEEIIIIFNNHVSGSKNLTFVILKMQNSQNKISQNMSLEETDRLIILVEKAIKENRSKEEIFETFKDAGIITKNGNLRAPYKEIYIPAEK